MPYDKKVLIDYRIQRARETVQEADMSHLITGSESL